MSKFHGPAKTCPECGRVFISQVFREHVQTHDMAIKAERFWARVDRRGPDACWLWMGYRNEWGYGMWIWGGGSASTTAHRVAYMLESGPIPDGLTLDHLCRNRLCVNPAHLEPVTRGENNRRGYGWSGVNARLTHCRHGHPLSGENLQIAKRGNGQTFRVCRTCRIEKDRRYRTRKAAA